MSTKMFSDIASNNMIDMIDNMYISGPKGLTSDKSASGLTDIVTRLNFESSKVSEMHDFYDHVHSVLDDLPSRLRMSDSTTSCN